MPDHVETVLRKTGPLLAAAACIWGAGIFADELPDSVRESALEELRVLDRVSTPKFRNAPASHSTGTANTTNPSPAKAVETKPHALTQRVTETTAHETTRSSLPSSAVLPSDAPDARPEHDTTPTIRPARPTITRPPIRSKPATWNPLESKPQPPVQPQHVETTDSLPAPSKEAGTLAPSAGNEPATETSPFAEVMDDHAVPQAEAANPFDTHENDWRPATNRTASPATSEPVPTTTAPAPRKADSQQPKTRSIAVAKPAKPAEQGLRSKSNAEQIGADRPVSVLDFLTQNHEPAASKNGIANAKAPGSSQASDASGAFARTEPMTAAREAGPTSNIKPNESAVVANGLPRSVRDESNSHQALESISESEATLATPPQDQFAQTEAPPSEQQKLDARAGRDGFMGYCPVTLRDHKTLVDGKSEFSSSNGGEYFEFASAEAKAAFDADPARYTPAHAGQDIVLSAGRITVPGSLRHATYYKNKLYLFRSQQTCRLFESDPARYVADDETERR